MSPGYLCFVKDLTADQFDISVPQLWYPADPSRYDRSGSASILLFIMARFLYDPLETEVVIKVVVEQICLAWKTFDNWHMKLALNHHCRDFHHFEPFSLSRKSSALMLTALQGSHRAEEARFLRLNGHCDDWNDFRFSCMYDSDLIISQLQIRC